MRPRDVDSESKERYDLAYTVLKFDLIPIHDYSRRTKEHCRTTVADLGLDHIRQAGLLLRREPLRLCGLNLGRDHLRQAGLLLRRDQLLPAGLFLWSDHLPAPPAGPISKAVLETKLKRQNYAIVLNILFNVLILFPTL